MLRKKLFIISLSIILFNILYANNEKILIESDSEIELFFENVEIDQIIFINNLQIKVDFDPDDKVTVEKENNTVYIKASYRDTKIELSLPKKAIYIYTFKYSEENSYCQFSMEKFYVYQNEKLVVHYKDNILSIEDDKNDSAIKIDKEKIEIINDNGSKTEISSDGIINSDKNKDDQFNGFWGKIIGNAIQYGIHLAINKIAETPEEMAKVFINSDLKEAKKDK